MQTRASLLCRIRDPADRPAWNEFVELYAPLLHRYAMKHGMQDADAADLAQDTLIRMLRAAPDFVYDPAKGSFRGWLLTVARNQLRKFAGRPQRRDAGTGDSEARARLEQLPDSADDDAWETASRQRVFQWAAERIRGEFRAATWQAFWRTAVAGERAEAVARELGLSVGAVYIARSRVTSRLRTVASAAEGIDA